MMYYALYYARVLFASGFFVLCVVVAACSVYAAEPVLRITEIMYDAEGRDEGKEFLEVINAGPGAIDMMTVKFFERSERHSGRSITQGRGNTVLQPGDVAVIVANPEVFLENYSFDGVVLDTGSFALLNAGTTVSLKITNRLLHSVSYAIQDGAKGDGNSLHIRQNDSIATAVPSPGVVNGIAIDTSGTTDANAAQDLKTDADADAQTTVGAQQPTAGGSDAPALVSDPAIVFSASTTEFSVVHERDGEAAVLYGLWNFGNGDHTYGAAVKHAYLYSGAYIIVFQELHEDGSEGVALQKEIQVLFPQVHIEQIDNVFVRLHNRHPFVLDVSGWRIESRSRFFTFPEKSLVPKQKSIVIPFNMSAGEKVFFITAGGGQFSGKQAYADVDADADRGQGSGTSAGDATTTADTRGQAARGDAVGATGVAVQDVASGEGRDTGERRDAGASGESRGGNRGIVIVADESRGESDKKTDATGFIGNTDERTEEKPSGIDARMVVVWVALLIGVITIALVPLLFTRWERHGRRKR